MKEININTAAKECSESENKIKYHFTYDSFSELFSDIKKALRIIVG